MIKESAVKHIIEEYRIRRSKTLRYAPTREELRLASKMYRVLLGHPEMHLIVTPLSISREAEEQIKALGFINEIDDRFGEREIPSDELMSILEKWNMSDHAAEKAIRIWIQEGRGRAIPVLQRWR